MAKHHPAPSLRFCTASDARRVPFLHNAPLVGITFAFAALWVYWTLADVSDMTNWTMENHPVFVFLLAAVLTYPRLKLSDLSYLLLAFFLAMHLYGAMHVYANNPLGNWLKDLFHAKRNFYDRIVHFSFGFLLGYPMRDLLMNGFGWTRRQSLWMPVVFSLAFGALYEIIEWAMVALFFP